MLATQITNHVQQALGRLMYQYQALPAQYTLLLNGTPAYVPPGAYTPFFSIAPTASLGFGYGNLTGVAQAFQVSSPLSIGQITVYAQAVGAVSPGVVTAYLYVDSGLSPGALAVPTNGPMVQSVEVYSTIEVAESFANQGSVGYVPLVFTFDFAFAPGYYWIVLSNNSPSSLGNSLTLGLANTAGLALANGFGAGQDVTGLFGPNSQSGLAQLALTVAEKTSAPPLQPSNWIQVSGIGAIIGAVADQVQVLENALFSINEGRQLFDGTGFPAVGVQLDGIGEIVGQPRNGLSDALYLIFILGKIGANFSNGTIPDLVSLISLVFQTPTFGLFPLYPAEIDIQIPASAGLPLSLFPQAIELVSESVDAGIRIGFGSVYPANGFAFIDLGGPPIGGGFGDLNNPNIGGGFASLFYSNAGA